MNEAGELEQIQVKSSAASTQTQQGETEAVSNCPSQEEKMTAGKGPHMGAHGVLFLVFLKPRCSCGYGKTGVWAAGMN